VDDRQASQALDDWSHAIHVLAVATNVRATAERFYADALAAPHPFASKIDRTYARLAWAIAREMAAEAAEGAAHELFRRTEALRDHRPVETEPIRAGSASG
jgi:hypothetical protein